MPRSPHNEHVIRKIREAIGLTQKEFAPLIGVTDSYIKKLEAGEKPMTPEVALRIHDATGADTWEIMKGERGEPFACARLSNGECSKLLTRELWEKWQRLQSSRKRLLTVDQRDRLLESDILSWSELLGQIRGQHPVAAFIRGKLQALTRNYLSSANDASEDSKLKNALLEDLNRIINGKSLYDVDRFEGIKLSSETAKLLSGQPDSVILNRRLLEEAFPEALRRSNLTVLDEVDNCAGQIGEFARLLFLAALRNPRTNLGAIFRAAFGALVKVCNDRELGPLFAEEWKKAHLKPVTIIPERDGIDGPPFTVCQMDFKLPELLMHDIPAMARILTPPVAKRAADANTTMAEIESTSGRRKRSKKA